jgi:tetratricopeptide (TPR) repeat protein
MRKLAVSLLVAVLAATSCAHVVSAEDRRRADAQYEVALTLVHEGERLGGEGDVAGQDLKMREALKQLLDAQKANPESSEIEYLFGVIYFVGFRRHVEAESHLKKAIALRGEEYPEAENLLGSVLVDAGRARDALPHFEKARTNLLYATPYFAEQEMGYALFKLGQHDEAAAHLRSAILAQPDLCGAYVKLAEVEEARGSDARVQEALAAFVERCDSDRLRAACGSRLLSYAYYRLGMSRLRTGDRGLAADALRVCRERFRQEAVSAECDRSLSALDVGG